MHKQLMPLKIPSGWSVEENSFFNIAPKSDEDFMANSGCFTEDLLWIQEIEFRGDRGWISKQDGLSIDLGWYPDSDVDGCYSLHLLRNSWDDIIFNQKTKDRYLIQALIDQILFLASNHRSQLTSENLANFAASWPIAAAHAST